MSKPIVFIDAGYLISRSQLGDLGVPFSPQYLGTTKYTPPLQLCVNSNYGDTH